MGWITQTVTVIIFLATVKGVRATEHSDIIGIVVAGCAGFVLLSLVIGILILACYWKSYIDNWMRQRGKTRMPREYFKKKEEAKQRLVSSSMASLVPNGHTPVDRDKMANGWHHGNSGVKYKVYEEKDATVELGEEVDDDYKIETAVVDNEVLDVGPFKHDHSKEIPVKGDVYSDPYLYSTVDTSRRSTSGASKSVKPSGENKTPVGLSTRESKLDASYSIPGEPNETKFDKSLLYM